MSRDDSLLLLVMMEVEIFLGVLLLKQETMKASMLAN